MSTHRENATPRPGRPKDPAKRQAILDAAKALFIQHGYDGCSMERLAHSAGVSKLTLYSHFTDKETLFAAAIEARCEELLPPPLFELPAGVPIGQALLAVARAFDTLIASPESLALHRLMIACAAQEPRLSQRFFEAGPRRLLQVMVRLLERAQANGALRVEEPARAAGHFFCLIEGVAHFRRLIGCADEDDENAREAHLQDVVQLFLRAYAG